MGSAGFVTSARSAAPPAAVFALLADAPAWQDWAGPWVPRARWEAGGPGGLGAVRRLGLGRLSVREQVVVHDPPTAFSYVLLSGRGWHGYRADVRLEEDGVRGTSLTWSGHLTSPVPGAATVLRPVFRALVRDFAARLVRRAEA